MIPNVEKNCFTAEDIQEYQNLDLRLRDFRREEFGIPCKSLNDQIGRIFCNACPGVTPKATWIGQTLVLNRKGIRESVVRSSSLDSYTLVERSRMTFTYLSANIHPTKLLNIPLSSQNRHSHTTLISVWESIHQYKSWITLNFEPLTIHLSKEYCIPIIRETWRQPELHTHISDELLIDRNGRLTLSHTTKSTEHILCTDSFLPWYSLTRSGVYQEILKGIDIANDHFKDRQSTLIQKGEEIVKQYGHLLVLEVL